MPHVVVRFARTATIVALFVVAAALGSVGGLLFAYAGDLPEISALDNYNPSTITRVQTTNGETIGEFAVQRRIVVGYDDISPYFRDAIISAEDAGFNSHVGLSISAIILRLTRDVIEAGEALLKGKRTRPNGASTLTQQLARNLFADRVGFEVGDMDPERKIKEAIVAVQIEKRYTKREILTLYANQMLFGHGTYGVEAAARMYFGKTAKTLSLEEAALLAGIVQLPARQSPFVNMDAAKRRRAYVLQRMADEGYLTQAQADTAKETPIVVRGEPQQPPSVSPYYLEEVRKYLERQYGAKALFESGLTVTTTLDIGLQTMANRALQNGLRAYDKRHGWRKPTRNVAALKKTIETFSDDRWRQPLNAGDIVPAVVVTAPKTGAARLRVGALQADLDRPGYAWTRKTSAADLFAPGDIVDVSIAKIDAEHATATVTLEQTPMVEGAILAIDNRTGQIKAMAGGWSFTRSKFNRAVQAYRQLGSTFKPIVYTTAIDRGYTAASVIVDEPVSYPAGNGKEYSPQNYDHRFEGPISLRWALEDSRNIPAIKLMDSLGPQTVLQYAKRFGFGENFPPYLPIALGAGDATLLEITSAYTTFPNQGVRMTPFSVLSVKDRNGNLLEENRATPSDVIRADTAFVLTSILRGVLQRGTGVRAASMAADWPLAGKTGTVDENTDAWFIGFDPNITVGVWIGFDDKRKSLGASEQGSFTALPIWMDFMKAYIAAQPKTETPLEFQAPGNIVFLPLATKGGISETAAPATISEAFIAGTQPGGALTHPQ